jgi:hypothetical protein
MKITKKEHEYLRTLKSGSQQREFSARSNKEYEKAKAAKARKETAKFVETLPPTQKEIELDLWLDAMLNKK